jgi:hypothetical protein
MHNVEARRLALRKALAFFYLKTSIKSVPFFKCVAFLTLPAIPSGAF